jgi:membrane fusion protein (multidrug efflux system)
MPLEALTLVNILEERISDITVKSEVRISKFEKNAKKQKIIRRISIFLFRILDFPRLFRASNFGFRIYKVMRNKIEQLKQVALKSLYVVIPLVIIGVIYSSLYESTDDAFIEGHVVAVSPRVSGTVKTVAIRDNEVVQKDQLLVEIDPRDYQTALSRAQGDADAAQADAAKAQDDVDRYRPLASRDEISKQQFKHLELTAQSAAAKAESAKAKLEQAELDLSYTRILAPWTGKVTKRSVEEGATVGTGQPLMALVSPEVWVVANFKETQIKKMKPGQKVKISIDALDKSFRGHVDSLQAGSGTRFSLFPPENATGNFVKVVQRVPVKVVFDEQAKELSQVGPGMSVVCRVRVK